MSLRSGLVGAVAGSLLALLGVGGCGAASGGGDYPSYSSVDGLFRSASLVVRARIEGSPEKRPIKIGDGDALDYTVVTARIERVFKGAAGGESIEVKQLDGEDGRVGLIPGTTYVLFLETYSDVPASLLNPTQAQYVVDPSGRLVPVGDNTTRVTAADLERLSTGG